MKMRFTSPEVANLAGVTERIPALYASRDTFPGAQRDKTGARPKWVFSRVGVIYFLKSRGLDFKD